ACLAQVPVQTSSVGWTHSLPLNSSPCRFAHLRRARMCNPRERESTMQYRLVSTIIATHNRPELITRTLDSLSRQTYRPLEVLVIDDGSQPPAQPLIDRWRACVDEDLHVSCLRQNNQGPAAARNKGIEQCSGDLIHFLDDD